MKLRQRKVRAFPKKDSVNRRAGRRCRDFEPSCIVCRYWRFKDETGRFPYSYVELTTDG